LHGVQGVASSNPATPTITNQRVSFHEGLARLAFQPWQCCLVCSGPPFLAAVD
jgi:hypothetical protein